VIAREEVSFYEIVYERKFQRVAGIDSSLGAFAGVLSETSNLRAYGQNIHAALYVGN